MTDAFDDPDDSDQGEFARGGSQSAVIGSESEEDSSKEFLLEAIRRQPILEALDAEPLTPSGMTDKTHLSRSTIHRAVDSLESYNLISQANGQYHLTNLGNIILEETSRFSSVAWSAASLEPFLNEIGGYDIPIEYFTEATITQRKPREPHVTIQRLIELIDASDHMLMLSTVLSSIHVRVGYRNMMEGMKIEAVFDEEAINIMLSKYQDEARETVSTGNFELYVHNQLPFELFVFDDKMGMAAHDDTGNAEILVECDSPKAIEWAENLYYEYRSAAEPLLLSAD